MSQEAKSLWNQEYFSPVFKRNCLGWHWGDSHLVLSASTVLKTILIFFKAPNPGPNDTAPTCHLKKYRKTSFYLSQRQRKRQTTWAQIKRSPTAQISKEVFARAIYRFLGAPPKPCFLITEFKTLKQLWLPEVSSSRQQRSPSTLLPLAGWRPARPAALPGHTAQDQTPRQQGK